MSTLGEKLASYLCDEGKSVAILVGPYMQMPSIRALSMRIGESLYENGIEYTLPSLTTLAIKNSDLRVFIILDGETSHWGLRPDAVVVLEDTFKFQSSHAKISFMGSLNQKYPLAKEKIFL